MTPHSGTHDTVVSIDIRSEREDAHGWVYDVEVLWKGQGVSEHEVTLSWVDHDALSGGSESPSRVVERVLSECAAGVGRGGVPERVDVSTLRRLLARA